MPLGHCGGGCPQWFGSLDGGSHGGLQYEIPGGHGGGSSVGVGSVGVDPINGCDSGGGASPAGGEVGG